MKTRTATVVGALFCAVAYCAGSVAMAQQVPSAPAPTSAAGGAAPGGTPKIMAPAASKNAGQKTKKKKAKKVQPEFITVTINKSKLLDISRAADEIVIGEPSVVEYKILDSGKVFLFGRALGTTNLYVLSRGRIIYEGEIRVTVDASEVAEAINAVLTDDTVSVRAGREAIFLTGKIRSPSAAADAVAIARRFVPADVNVINLMQIQAKHQVLLRVKVAELNRTTIKDLGVRFGFLGGDTDLAGRLVPNGFDLAVGQTVGTGFGVLNVLHGDFDLTLEALESQNLVRILAEPTLTAISGETASLLAGGETPVPTAFDTDSNTITFEFIEFGVNLAFTPIVMSDRRINLDVATEVSSLTPAVQVAEGIGIQGRSIRRATTTVDLPSGGTIMIAGLIKQDETMELAGVPGAKDVPVLGALFRSQNFSREESELAIIITAYLVKPLDTVDKLSTPTDGFGPASDIDFFLLGKLHKEYTDVDLPPWAATLKGPYGYILE